MAESGSPSKSGEDTTEEDIKTTTTASDSQKNGEEKDSDGTSSQKSSSSSSSRRNKRKAQQPIKQTTGILTTEVKKPKVTKSNSSDRPYVCTTCLKSFTRSHHLTRHEYSHTGERPFMCVTCGKTFVRKHKLTVHIRSHTGEKPYLCSVCSKGFSSSEKRKLHERIHSGEKPYPCTLCEKRFKSSSQVKRHTESHKKQQAIESSDGFGCNICYKVFVSEYHLANHKSKHNRKKKTAGTEESTDSSPKTPKKRTPRPKKDPSLAGSEEKKGDLKIKVIINTQNKSESSVENISQKKLKKTGVKKKIATSTTSESDKLISDKLDSQSEMDFSKEKQTPIKLETSKINTVQPVYRKFYEEVSISASEAAKSAESVFQKPIKLEKSSTVKTKVSEDFDFKPIGEIIPSLPNRDFSTFTPLSSLTGSIQIGSPYSSNERVPPIETLRNFSPLKTNSIPQPAQYLGSEYSLSRDTPPQFLPVSEHSPYKQYCQSNVPVMTNPSYNSEVTVQTSNPYPTYPTYDNFSMSPSPQKSNIGPAVPTQNIGPPTPTHNIVPPNTTMNNGAAIYRTAACMYTTMGQNGHTTTQTYSNTGSNRDYNFSRFGSLN